MNISINNHEVATGAWALDPSHSELGFTVRHAGISKVRGKFTDVVAVVNATEDFKDFSINATVQANSFTTGDEGRDGHVKSADFFDVEKYPTLTFVSTSLVPNGEDFILNGDLTILDVTKSISFDVEFNGVAVDPFGLTRAGLSATSKISRKDFGLTWNAALAAGGVLVGDKVSLGLELSFIHN